MTVPLRAALYLRVSTARQAEPDVSIPDLKRQGEAYCASRGYQLVETCVEAGASATNDRRPEFPRIHQVVAHLLRDRDELDAVLGELPDGPWHLAARPRLRGSRSAAESRSRSPAGHSPSRRTGHAWRSPSTGTRRTVIIGSKSNLLQTLTAAAGAKPATAGVRSSVLKWRMGCPPWMIDSNMNLRIVDQTLCFLPILIPILEGRMEANLSEQIYHANKSVAHAHVTLTDVTGQPVPRIAGHGFPLRGPSFNLLHPGLVAARDHRRFPKGRPRRGNDHTQHA
jgi:Resolvase, N terminal domain